MGKTTPVLTIEHLTDGAFVAAGFYSMSARVLLDFCEQHGLNCHVIFTSSPHIKHRSFQIHFFYDANTPPAVPEKTLPTLDLDSLCESNGEGDKLRQLIKIVPNGISSAKVVTFPRVLLVRMHFSSQVTAADLENLIMSHSVLDVRLGGLSQAVEVVLRRTSRFAKDQFQKKKIQAGERRGPKRAMQTRVLKPLVHFKDK
jgi:hypothetical protein